jgi:hypothetical protein
MHSLSHSHPHLPPKRDSGWLIRVCAGLAMLCLVFQMAIIARDTCVVSMNATHPHSPAFSSVMNASFHNQTTSRLVQSPLLTSFPSTRSSNTTAPSLSDTQRPDPLTGAEQHAGDSRPSASTASSHAPTVNPLPSPLSTRARHAAAHPVDHAALPSPTSAAPTLPLADGSLSRSASLMLSTPLPNRLDTQDLNVPRTPSPPPPATHDHDTLTSNHTSIAALTTTPVPPGDTHCALAVPFGPEWTAQYTTWQAPQFIAGPTYRPIYELLDGNATLGVGVRYDEAFGHPRLTSWFVPSGVDAELQLVDVVINFDDHSTSSATAVEASSLPLFQMLDSLFTYGAQFLRQVMIIAPPSTDVSSTVAHGLAAAFRDRRKWPVNVVDAIELTGARDHSVDALTEVLARRVGLPEKYLRPFVTANRKLVIDYLIEANLHRVPNAGRFTLYVPDPRASPFTRTLNVTDFFARVAPSSSPRTTTENLDAPSPRVTSLGTLHPRLAVPADVAACLSVTDTETAASSSLPVNRTTIIACIAAALTALPTSAKDAFFYDNQVVRWASNTRVLEPWASLPCAHGSFRYYYAVAAIKQLLDEPSLGADALRQVIDAVGGNRPTDPSAAAKRRLLQDGRRSTRVRVATEAAQLPSSSLGSSGQPVAAAHSLLSGRPRLDPLYDEVVHVTDETNHEFATPRVTPTGTYTFDPSDLPTPTRMFVRYRRSKGRGLLHRLTSAPNDDSELYHDFDAVGVQEVQEDGTYGPVQWRENRFLDVVITHVDLHSPGFAQLLDEWRAASKLDATEQRASPNRFRNFDELKYNIKSLRHNAGRIVRKIFVVVNSVEHVPTWLVPTDDLKVITHKDIFTPEWKAVEHPYLPTFNSLVIESFLHRIPGLSPFFMYANNDQFIGRRLSVWDLFRPKAESRPRRFLPNDDIWEDSDDDRNISSSTVEELEVEPILYGEPSLHMQRELRCTLKSKPADGAPTLFCPRNDDNYIVHSVHHSTNLLWQKYRVFSAHYFWA